MPGPNAAALLRRNMTDLAIRDRPALKFGDREWTHGEYVAEAFRWAQLFLARAPSGHALHVGVLLDNTPDYLFALGGAALAGAAVVGLNHTRRDEHLLRDIEHTHVGLIVTEPRHQALLEPIAGRLPTEPDNVLVSTRFTDTADPAPSLGKPLDDALAAVPGDVGYVCMPLFHSNALMVGWAPSIVYGASVGLARKFSASRWLADVRRYGATYFNYTGKPLAYLLGTPERADDAENPLRVAFGNEGSPEVVEAFARRFGVEVIDAYGATEGGVAVDRDAEDRAGALGKVAPTVKVVDDHGVEKPRAHFDSEGRLTNAEECVGEIVNTAGAGPFEGYYNNAEANDRTLRFGWYWTGDLGYLDDDGYLYFAGRNADWLRVDGENFPAGPIEATLGHHPDVVLACVYGVPDDQAGDQVMAGIVLRDGARFDPVAFAAWIDGRDEIGPKWRPRYLRTLSDPPTTGTNKIVKRSLVHQKWRADRVGDDQVYVRERGEPAFRPFTPNDERALHESFVRYRRERFWDL